MKTSKIEIVKKKGQWHARIKSANGKILATTEKYKRRRSAIEALDSIHVALIHGKQIDVTE